MLRIRLNEALKDAMKAKNAATVATLRLILAAIKDRDIAARTRGITDGVDEGEILSLLQTMIKQRRESIELYQKGGRPELAQQEADEITVIEGFMPQQMSDAEMADTLTGLITEIGATGIKDMGRVMAELRTRYAGQMDFTKASALVRQKLTG